jgi:hypothetical protein
VGGAARIVLGLLYPRRFQKTYHAAGGGCRNRACQVRSWSSEEAGLDLPGNARWKIGPVAHTCASALGVSADPPVVGRDWSPVSSNKARGYCCRTTGEHCAPLQPGRAARRYLRVRGTARTDSRGSGVGLAPRPAAAMVPYRKALCKAGNEEANPSRPQPPTGGTDGMQPAAGSPTTTGWYRPAHARAGVVVRGLVYRSPVYTLPAAQCRRVAAIRAIAREAERGLDQQTPGAQQLRRK